MATITQERGFLPIIIILETEEEAQYLHDALGEMSEGPLDEVYDFLGERLDKGDT